MSLNKIPVKLHPDQAMVAHFVDLFIRENPNSFKTLVEMIDERRDLIVIMNEFIEFIHRNGFDSKYSEYSVFGGLCQEASSAANRK